MTSENINEFGLFEVGMSFDMVVALVRGHNLQHERIGEKNNGDNGYVVNWSVTQQCGKCVLSVARKEQPFYTVQSITISENDSGG